MHEFQPWTGEVLVRVGGAGACHSDPALRWLPAGPGFRDAPISDADDQGDGTRSQLLARPLQLAARSARMLADLTIVGLGGGTLPVCFFGIPYEVSDQSTYRGNRAELVDVLDLATRGSLHAEITRFDLDQAEQAYQQLRSGAVDGRVVVVPERVATAMN